MPEHQGIESPGELGDRLWSELLELVDEGELSVSVAERIRDGLFEEGRAGERPRLRWSVWSAYVSQLMGDSS
jgi:hypothetical protein